MVMLTVSKAVIGCSNHPRSAKFKKAPVAERIQAPVF